MTSSLPPTRPRWARPVLGWLDRSPLPCRRWVYKLYRTSLPRPYKHLANNGPRFHLEGSNPNLEREIIWDGQITGKTQPLTNIENRHRGKACFVLGTGPSINELDLHQLGGHPVIGVNGAIAVMAKYQLRPAHYTVTDLDFFENRFAMIRQVIESGSSCFFSSGGLRIIAEKDPTLLAAKTLYLSEVVNRPYGRPRLRQEEFLRWANEEEALVLPQPPRDDDSRVGWSRDLRHGVFCSRTILFRALQIAAFLGYERIYVLGMDLNYKGPEARAYDEGAKARPTKIERDFEPFILPAFQVLKGEIEAGRLEVYNLSDKSRLPEDVLPRLSYAAALEREQAAQSRDA